jgi:3-methyladenine DNA glycosylase AlkD
MSQHLGLLRERLAQGADPQQAAAQRDYHKGAMEHLGWRGPALKAVQSQLVTQLKQSPEEALELGWALVDSPVAEEQSLGMALLERFRKHLPAQTVAQIEPIFDRRVQGWATCDGICGRVLRWRLSRPPERARISGWARHESPWRRRAACVAFVNEARHGLYSTEVREVVEGALALDHRFAQLGAGWLLRERWLAAPAEVTLFLERRGSQMRREALRYAVEKMPAGQQRRLLGAGAE